ncbi:MAG TPA: hypothetical protein DCS93_33080 [Microscillaceae bacterium]|nr:hypothetical protein [Microscillaceae bacterium]
MKINKHKRFNFTPRYYDPVKERIEEKITEARIAQGKEVESSEGRTGYSVRISDAFSRRERQTRSVGAFRLVFLLSIILVLASYVMYGSETIKIAGLSLNYGEYFPYVLGIVIVGYIFLRLKRKV